MTLMIIISLKLPLDEKLYLLHDPEGEKRHGFSLRESIARAKERVSTNSKVFAGHHFYFTSMRCSDSGANEVVRRAIRAHGGTVSTSFQSYMFTVV